jgi:two-component system, OmpR family, copper resistance phosphate regulon response regulator CusR
MPAAKIVIVEDEVEVVAFICQSLYANGFHTAFAYDGETGLQLVKSVQPQLVIVDVIMPQKNGLQMCRELRASGYTMPVLMLTAMDSTPDIVAGLDAGADDYLSKPFELAELLARIRALLRRKSSIQDVQQIQIGDLIIDLKSKQVTRGSLTIQLTAKEFRLLEFMAKNKGQLKSRSSILIHEPI